MADETPQPLMFYQNKPERFDGPFTPDNVVPARVNAAIDFAYIMAKRQYPMMAVNDLSIEFEPAPAMSKMEISAHDAALLCLSDYFRGQMDSTFEEDQRRIAANVETDRRRVGKVYNCGCQGKGCDTCAGSGKILVIPAPSEQPDSPKQNNETPKKEGENTQP